LLTHSNLKVREIFYFLFFLKTQIFTFLESVVTINT
jgi:hypothetical protein